jgi:hypothetical protein
MDLTILAMKESLLDYELLSNLNMLICFCREAGLQKYTKQIAVILHSFISNSKNYLFYFQCSQEGEERIR